MAEQQKSETKDTSQDSGAVTLAAAPFIKRRRKEILAVCLLVVVGGATAGAVWWFWDNINQTDTSQQQTEDEQQKAADLADSYALTEDDFLSAEKTSDKAAEAQAVEDEYERAVALLDVSFEQATLNNFDDARTTLEQVSEIAGQLSGNQQTEIQNRVDGMNDYIEESENAIIAE